MMAEHRKCIALPFEDQKNQSWCGRMLSSFDWRFSGLDHAAATLQGGSRLEACSRCVAAAYEVLRP